MKPKIFLNILMPILMIGIALAIIFWPKYTTPKAKPTPFADDRIQLDSPLPGSYVKSPLVVTGRARGTWFFEASFPVIITDWDGKIIAQVPAQAQGDWMTTDWVKFRAVITFQKPSYSNRGELILHNDNPSGDPSRAEAREIPIFFQ